MSGSVAAVRRTTRLFVVLVTSLAAMAASALAYADGVDVSHWQGSVSWTKVKAAGMQFAFMKATESTTYTDTQLATNWAGTQAVGLYRGAYHFARPSTSAGSAAKQAAYFVSKVGSFQNPGTLPPVLDLEATGGLSVTSLRTWTATWLSEVERLTGRVPMIYVSPAFWEDHLGNSTAFTRYPLWIAHYGVSSPRVPGGWPTWTFWQRTSSGSVSGISGNVDMNRFNGTTAQLAALAITTGGSTVPVPPGPSVPAVSPTTLTATPSATTVPVRGALTITGSLTRATDGAPLANLPVVLQSRPVGSTTWKTLGTVTTDANGAYAAATTVPSATEYQTVYGGDGSTLAPATSARTQVLNPAPARVTVYLHKNTTAKVRKGTAVMVYGHIKTAAGPITGKSVRFYQRRVGTKRWSYVRRTTSLAPTGWYSTVVRPRRSMTYKVVSFAAPGLRSSTSNLTTVRTR